MFYNDGFMVFDQNNKKIIIIITTIYVMRLGTFPRFFFAGEKEVGVEVEMEVNQEKSIYGLPKRKWKKKTTRKFCLHFGPVFFFRKTKPSVVQPLLFVANKRASAATSLTINRVVVTILLKYGGI